MSTYDEWKAIWAGKFTSHTFTEGEQRRETLEDWRQSVLAQALPKQMFSTSSKKFYLMKEVLMLQPRGSRLLVKRIDTPKPTSSLLVIPETVDGEASCYAIVLAIGNKVSEDVKVADTVILAKYCGSPVNVELDGETLEAQIVMEEDVLAVVGEE